MKSLMTSFASLPSGTAVANAAGADILPIVDEE